MSKEMMKGSVDLLLLSLLEQRDLYGYEISQILKRLSDGTYEMSEGTLYAALKRLERKSYVESYWQKKTTGRRKYYRMTKHGLKELEVKRKNWRWMDELIQKGSEGLL